jgi:tRNA(Ile)-lysidine synthase
MPYRWERGGLTYCRPFLRVSGADIRLWLSLQQVAFVEDPTNTDVRFTRNRIRAQILPALQAAFPQFRDTFARSASHAAQAQELLDELGAQDAKTVAGEDGHPRIKALQALSRARQANALRYWLRDAYGVAPSAAQLQELQDQIAACVTRGHHIHIKVGQGVVQRSAAKLTWYTP